MAKSSAKKKARPDLKETRRRGDKATRKKEKPRKKTGRPHLNSLPKGEATKKKRGRKVLVERDPLTDAKWLTTVNVIALAYNDTTRWIQKLSKLENGLPKEIKGKYHLVKVLRWTVEYYKRKVAELEAGGSRAEQHERLRILSAKARKQETETARELGEAIGVEDAIGILAPVLKDLQQALLGLPNRMAPLLAHRDERDIKRLMDDDVRKLLDNASTIPDAIERKAALQAKTARDLPPAEGAAVPEGEPVGGPVQDDRRGHGSRARKVEKRARAVSDKTIGRHVRHGARNRDT